MDTKLSFSIVVVSWLTLAAWHFNDLMLSMARVSLSFWSTLLYATLQVLCTPSLSKRGIFLGRANYLRPGHVESMITYGSFDIQVAAFLRYRGHAHGDTRTNE